MDVYVFVYLCVVVEYVYGVCAFGCNSSNNSKTAIHFNCFACSFSPTGLVGGDIRFWVNMMRSGD